VYMKDCCDKQTLGCAFLGAMGRTRRDREPGLQEQVGAAWSPCIVDDRFKARGTHAGTSIKVWRTAERESLGGRNGREGKPRSPARRDAAACAIRAQQWWHKVALLSACTAL